MDRITLKNIKVSEFASQETFCYEASVYFDGKRIGTVMNQGHGGADYEYPIDKTKWKEAKEYAASLKSPPNEFDGHMYPESLESICHHLVADHMEAKDYKKAVNKVKRLLAKRTVFLVAGQLRDINRPISDRMRQHLKLKHPSAEILNDWPLDKAVSALVQ